MSEHDGGFENSLADLMASVAVMFLLIAAIFMVRSLAQAKRSQDLAQEFEATLLAAKEENKTSQEALQELVAELKGDSSMMVELDYDPAVDPFVVTIIFNEQILHFAPSSDKLDKAGLETIKDSGKKILDRTCRLVTESGRVQQITLEGHTDNQRFGRAVCESRMDSAECERKSFEKNVRLSANRAQTVYFEMMDAISDRPDLKNCLNSRFVVSGRGPVEPLGNTDWEAEQDDEERRRNRRVVIKVRMRSDVKSLSAGLP